MSIALNTNDVLSRRILLVPPRTALKANRPTIYHLLIKFWVQDGERGHWDVMKNYDAEVQAHFQIIANDLSLFGELLSSGDEVFFGQHNGRLWNVEVF